MDDRQPVSKAQLDKYFAERIGVKLTLIRLTARNYRAYGLTDNQYHAPLGQGIPQYPPSTLNDTREDARSFLRCIRKPENEREDQFNELANVAAFAYLNAYFDGDPPKYMCLW